MLTMTDMHLDGPHPEPGESRSFPGLALCLARHNCPLGTRSLLAVNPGARP